MKGSQHSPGLSDHAKSFDQVLHQIGRLSHDIVSAIDGLGGCSRGDATYHDVMYNLVDLFSELRGTLDRFDRYRDEYERIALDGSNTEDQ